MKMAGLFMLLTDEAPRYFDPSMIFTYILGALIILIAISAVRNRLKTKEGQAELDAFLNKIYDTVLDETLKAISRIDFHSLSSMGDTLQDAQIYFLNNLYTKIWGYCAAELDKEYKDNPLYAIMRATLTPEFLQSFSSSIIESPKVKEMIDNLMVKAINEEHDTKMEAERLERQYVKLAYEVEHGGKDEKPIEEISPEVAAGAVSTPIIPPSEEEDSSNEGVEIISESTITQEDLDDLNTPVVQEGTDIVWKALANDSLGQLSKEIMDDKEDE